MSKANVKNDRCLEINRVLTHIARHGRRFFYSKESMLGRETFAYFFVKDNGSIFFVDNYTEQRIYVAYKGRWQHFSHGGTLRSLVLSMAEYIRSGQPIPRFHFGPWPDRYCGGDLWGYGDEAMNKLRAEIAQSPAVEPEEAKAA